MSETFYSVLGLNADADQQAIRDAYRQQVKETHPDVSDDADASQQFKQVTTARDVLLDDDERARYDRIGHESYVRKHVQSDAWSVNEPSATQSTSSGADPVWEYVKGTEAYAETTAGTNTNRTRSGRTTTGTNQTRNRKTRGSKSRTDGGYQTEDWQQASEAYRVSTNETDFDSQRSLWDVAKTLRSLGPWLVIHFFFAVSALITVWFSFFSGARSTGMFIASVLFVMFVFMLSVFHVLLKLNS